jgi:phosphoglycolate phosphatase-like HAD superfamily hydrolase
VYQSIRLLVFDLDYLVFDCALIKTQALRQGLVSLAEAIPHATSLPDELDIQEAFLDHGISWVEHLDLGLSHGAMGNLQQTFSIHESGLIESGVGALYAGLENFLLNCQKMDIAVALGAEATRDYLLAVADKYQLDTLFQPILCTEEFGSGCAEEMYEEIMQIAEALPSETIVLGTRPRMFEAAHAVDAKAIGCGWGMRNRGLNRLKEADFQAASISQLDTILKQVDEHLSSINLE